MTPRELPALTPIDFPSESLDWDRDEPKLTSFHGAAWDGKVVQ